MESIHGRRMSFAAAAAEDNDVMTSNQQSRLITTVLFITVEMPRSALYWMLHLDRTHHNAIFDPAFFLRIELSSILASTRVLIYFSIIIYLP